LDDAMNEYIKVGELEKSRIAVSHNNIGGIYFLKGNKDKALEYCLMATNEDDKYTDAFSNVAVIYATKDNPVEALKYIKKSLALDSENETAIGNYRSIMNKINEMNKAKAAPKTSILDRLGE
jgi:tetratricopeptide (TPR) repeat protein